MTSGLLKLHGESIASLQRAFDPIAITLLFVLFNRSYQSPAADFQSPYWFWFALLVTILLRRSGIYTSYRSLSLLLLARRVTTRWLLVLAALLFIGFATNSINSFSRFNIFLWASSSLFVLLASHVGLRKLLRIYRSRGGNSRTILYWGSSSSAAKFADELAASPWMGLKIIAWFGPKPTSTLSYHSLPEYGGHINDMRLWIDLNSVDRLVFSHASADGVEISDLLRIFGDLSIPVIYAPAWACSSMHFTSDQIGSQSCIDIWGSRQRLLDRQLKRACDLLLGIASVLILAPLFLFVAIAVKLTSPGPVLFRQERYGLDGKPFNIYKFRSMYVCQPRDQTALKQATRNDPRVTPLGAFLRRWSLDELPQLFNVLIGDMSLVGPRPHASEHNEFYRLRVPGYMQRHSFKPGITGLAQVEGWRGETSTISSMANRVAADLRYQRTWSLSLDFKILLKTFLSIRSTNAY